MGVVGMQTRIEELSVTASVERVRGLRRALGVQTSTGLTLRVGGLEWSTTVTRSPIAGEERRGTKLKDSVWLGPRSILASQYNGRELFHN